MDNCIQTSNKTNDEYWYDKAKEQISGALARGYCTDLNRDKELDANLIDAMSDEILHLFDARKLMKMNQVLDIDMGESDE